MDGTIHSDKGLELAHSTFDERDQRTCDCHEIGVGDGSGGAHDLRPVGGYTKRTAKTYRTVSAKTNQTR